MKYLVVLAICFTAVSCAPSDIFSEYQAACLAENNLKADALKDDDNLKNTCYYDCFYKKDGMVREDGTFNINEIIGMPLDSEKIPKGAREKATKEVEGAIRTCKSQAGGDNCKIVHCVHTILAN